MKKYKRLKGHKTQAATFLERIAETQPGLFVHWQRGINRLRKKGAFVAKPLLF
jgi:hypothetical protein